MNFLRCYQIGYNTNRRSISELTRIKRFNQKRILNRLVADYINIHGMKGKPNAVCQIWIRFLLNTNKYNPIAIAFAKKLIIRKYSMRLSCIATNMQSSKQLEQADEIFSATFINHTQTNILNGKVPIKNCFNRGFFSHQLVQFFFRFFIIINSH